MLSIAACAFAGDHQIGREVSVNHHLADGTKDLIVDENFRAREWPPVWTREARR